jgi:hypothetical protein
MSTKITLNYGPTTKQARHRVPGGLCFSWFLRQQKMQRLVFGITHRIFSQVTKWFSLRAIWRQASA